MSNYVTLYTTSNKMVVYLTIKGILEKLPADNFVQVHKSAVVNKDKITSIEGNMVCIGDTKITTGASYNEAVMKRILGDRFLKR